jgi:hypothetical protein
MPNAYICSITMQMLQGHHNELLDLVLQLIIRFSLNIITLIILLRYIYFTTYNKSELFFTFVVFNIILFLVCFFLNRIEFSIGAAFGLFAVFGMLRYRTEELSIRDMSYLFFVIALGLLHAVSHIHLQQAYFEFIFIGAVDIVLLVLAAVLEHQKLFQKEAVTLIQYDNLELLQPFNKAALYQDLKKRTGLNITRIHIIKIDFIKASAQLRVYCKED